MIGGVKYKDPVKVRSLTYYDEDKPNVDGVQTAEEVETTKSEVYYAPNDGIMADPTLCLGNKSPSYCVHNSNCGWC